MVSSQNANELGEAWMSHHAFGRVERAGAGQDGSKAPGVDGVGPSSCIVVGEVVPVQCTFIHLC